jgi:type VI secretion system protein ImpA
LEQAMQPRVEVVRDDRNAPVSQMQVPVDWADVQRRAEELRIQGRDLRLLVILTRALANQTGFAGLAEGLTLIARTFDTHWDTMHPELRAGVPPREAALRRINALLQLQNDQDGVLDDLRRLVVFAPRGVGPITGRELERAAIESRTAVAEGPKGLGETERAAIESQHEQLLNRVRKGCASMADQARPEIEAQLAAARTAVLALRDVETVLAARLGGEAAVTLPALSRFLDRLTATLERGVSGPAVAPGSAAQGNGSMEISSSSHSTSGNGAEPSRKDGYVGFPERLSSRDDVVKCLDLIISFYDRTEPSSPIPHLARRIRRMVPMDFLELMEDLAPSGLKEFRMLAGVSDGKKSAQKDER